jgi:hypothetical protein
MGAWAEAADIAPLDHCVRNERIREFLALRTCCNMCIASGTNVYVSFRQGRDITGGSAISNARKPNFRLNRAWRLARDPLGLLVRADLTRVGLRSAPR